MQFMTTTTTLHNYYLRIERGFDMTTENMKNVSLHVEGNKLIIEVELDKQFGLSSSGKSITVASTSGNVGVPGHEEIKLGLNVYKPAKSR